MTRPIFYAGIHRPAHAFKVRHAMLSVNVLQRRKSPFQVNQWILDSGAFTRITQGQGHMDIREYALQIQRWAECGDLQAAVSQDYMCEAIALKATGSTVSRHQRLTTLRYRYLSAAVGATYIMPVLQGFSPDDYRRHVSDYGVLLRSGAWVGVGSVCKRNGRPAGVRAILQAIKQERPDLRLHGFGLKKTALALGSINELLYSSDSMAWSLAARLEGRDSNDINEAVNYAAQMQSMPIQGELKFYHE